MTETVKNPRKVIDGSGWANPLTHDVLLESTSHLTVWADDVELTLGVDYTLTNASGGTPATNDPDGYRVVVSSPGSWDPDVWVLEVAYPVTQGYGFTPSFGAQYEGALDALARRVQMLQDGVNRAAKLDRTQPDDVFGPSLPAAAEGKALVWDAAGDLINGPGVDDIAVAQGYAAEAKEYRDTASTHATSAANSADAAANAAAEAAEAAEAVAAGGATGQVLTKASGVDYDTTWTTVATLDGSQALALAGSDTSQRTWQAANIKDASLYWSRHQADFVAAPAVTGSDDTANVQATIDALTAGVAYFPAGTYYIDSVTLKEGVAVRGAPGGGTIFKARSNSINMLTMSATSATKTFVDIADIRFDGNGKTNVSAVYLNGVDSAKRISYIKLERLHVSGCNEGLHLYYAANTFISDCFVTGTAFGVHLDMCADTDVLATRVQNGSNAGFYIVGGAGAYDEGMRLIGCSTNGQQIGLWVSGQDWGVASGCSFTTAAGGAGIFQSSTNWKLFGSEWAVAGGTPAAAGINIDSSCSDFIVESNEIALNTYGIIASGSRHRIGGNNLKSNSNVDIYLDGVTKSTIGGNICDSSTVSWSILEAGAADYNNAQGNTGNGTFTKVGANSVFANNITY